MGFLLVKVALLTTKNARRTVNEQNRGRCATKRGVALHKSGRNCAIWHGAYGKNG